MTKPAESIADLYANWPIEKLVRAAYVDSKEYDHEAVQIMRQVLKRKGVLKQEIDGIVADLRAANVHEPLNRIRGWLLVLVLQVTLGTMGDLMNGALMLLGATAWPPVAIAAICTSMGIYGAYCSRLLTSHSPEAPRHTRQLMMVWIAASLVNTGLWALHTGEPLRGAGSGVLFGVPWYVYLGRSKRVAMVYRARVSR